MTGKRVVYHITADHPSKGSLAAEEIGRRLRQFPGIGPVLFTGGDRLYVQKAERFPNVDMVIGVDAVLGILNPKYYDDGKTVRWALETMRRSGTRLYVIGREIEGRFMTAADLPIPSEFHGMFIPVPGRWDVSSRALRAAKSS